MHEPIDGTLPGDHLLGQSLHGRPVHDVQDVGRNRAVGAVRVVVSPSVVVLRSTAATLARGVRPRASPPSDAAGCAGDDQDLTGKSHVRLRSTSVAMCC
jgi:hypothetical protein